MLIIFMLHNLSVTEMRKVNTFRLWMDFGVVHVHTPLFNTFRLLVLGSNSSVHLTQRWVSCLP